MKISLNILDEKLVDLVVICNVFRVVFLELTEQQHVLFSFEETWNLS